MLILILINIQYLQNVVFSSEEGQNGQNHSSVTHHQLKNPPRQDFASPLLGKPLPTPCWHYLQNPARHIIKGLVVYIFLDSEM